MWTSAVIPLIEMWGWRTQARRMSRPRTMAAPAPELHDPAGGARCTSAACRTGYPRRGCAGSPTGDRPGSELVPRGGHLADHAPGGQRLPAGRPVVAGLQVHHWPLGQRDGRRGGVQVAASSPSSRWLAGAGSAARGCHPPPRRSSASAPVAAVHRARAGGLAATGCLGGAAVHRQVLKFQAEQLLVGGQPWGSQSRRSGGSRNAWSRLPGRKL
jgi:hypothetical protein